MKYNMRKVNTSVSIMKTIAQDKSRVRVVTLSEQGYKPLTYCLERTDIGFCAMQGIISNAMEMVL